MQEGEREPFVVIGVVVELKVSLKEKETAKQVNEIRVFYQAGRKCLVVKEKIYILASFPRWLLQQP